MVAGMRLSLFAIRAAVARRGITPVACYAIAVPLWHFYFSVQLLFRVLEDVQLVLVYIYIVVFMTTITVLIVYRIKKIQVLASSFFFRCNYVRFSFLENSLS